MPFLIEKTQGALVCPRCHAKLVQDGDSLICTDPDTRLRYPVLDGIPRLLADEAEILSSEAWQEAMTRASQP